MVAGWHSPRGEAAPPPHARSFVSYSPASWEAATVTAPSTTTDSRASAQQLLLLPTQPRHSGG
eukprot:537232-Prymnesium_polylepis.1